MFPLVGCTFQARVKRLTMYMNGKMVWLTTMVAIAIVAVTFGNFVRPWMGDLATRFFRGFLIFVMLACFYVIRKGFRGRKGEGRKGDTQH